MRFSAPLCLFALVLFVAVLCCPFFAFAGSALPYEATVFVSSVPSFLSFASEHFVAFKLASILCAVVAVVLVVVGLRLGRIR